MSDKSAKPHPIEPRKAPRQARSNATVDAILEAAAHILREEGLVPFTTNAVAQRAGASIGSLYQYFPGKDAILTELIRRKRQTMLDAIRLAARETRSRPFAEAVDRLIAAGIAHQLDDPQVSRALEYAEATLPLHTETHELKMAIVAEVSATFAARGFSEPEIAAHDVVALTRGMIDTAGLYGETDASSLTDRVRRAVTGYLKTAPKVSRT
tara:strand:+ start:4879 stop:5511 length:633 start_codon:yes stop_codon:yes gene_type:complete